jgi:heat-inducible transcriptional repressor
VTLDGRKGKILHAIVEDYVESADPIGSEWLVTHHDFGCKSATLRNEMSEMSDLGYLRQPHTSAGRIPSDRGYRYYVDRLMPAPTYDDIPDPVSITSISKRASEVDEIVQHTCRILSGMAQYPSVATPPSLGDTLLHKIYLTLATERQALLVILLSAGHVEHRLVGTENELSLRSLERVANYLNSQLAGCSLDDIGKFKLPAVPVELYQDSALATAVTAALVDAAKDLAENRVFLEGTSHILRQREFQDVSRLEQLLSSLEQHHILCQVLGRALLGQQVTIIIGAESPVEAMQDCSVVTSHYRIGDRVGGFIGVVGPTRMKYDRAVGAVGLMARNLSMLLTRHSLG